MARCGVLPRQIRLAPARRRGDGEPATTVKRLAAGPRRRGLGGGDEVGEQVIDALSLVVMDPVRGVGQALDVVEVGHIVVLGLG
jgi:hypothetical protein